VIRDLRTQPGERDGGWWLTQGADAGLVAGILFAAFAMVTAWLTVGTLWLPLRMIGAIGLGPAALDPGYPLVTAAAVGVVVHMVLSVAFGAVFGAVVGTVPVIARSGGRLLAAASAYGLVLWVVNLYVVSPVFGWSWFPEQTNALQQFVAHTFFFGTVLGFYLDRAHGAGRTRAV
jgi:hypothetical protein